MATKTKLKATGNASFPDDMAEWLESQRKKGNVARLVQTTEAQLGVHPQTGEVAGNAPHAEWEGDPSWPLWAGDPFTPHRGRENGDPPGLYFHETPFMDSPGGVSCWRVAEDPACHCGVFLNSDFYGGE